MFPVLEQPAAHVSTYMHSDIYIGAMRLESRFHQCYLALLY